jgi:hypothetical protein
MTIATMPGPADPPTTVEKSSRAKRSANMELGASAQRGIGLVPEENEATRFKPGQSGNPKGRPRGSRHKISEAFCCRPFGRLPEQRPPGYRTDA